MRVAFLAIFFLLSLFSFAQDRTDFEKAVAVYNSGDYERAYLLMDDWLRVYDRDPQGYYYLGQIYEQFDGASLNLALENYQKALSLDPELAEAYLTRGRLYLRLKRFQDAENDFLTYRQIPKGETSEIIYRKGSTDKGVSGVFTAQSPNPSQILYHLALAKIGMEDYTGAKILLDSAIFYTPNESDFWAEKGHAEMRQNLKQDALKSLHQAVEINPDHFLARQRINILEKGENVDQLEELTLAIAKDPEDPQGWKVRGFYKYSQNDWEGAIEDYTESIKILPEDSEGWFYRAKAYAKLKNWEASEADFEEVLFIDEQDSEALLGRGQSRYYLNRPEEALADFIELIIIDPSNPSAYYHRGITLHRLDKKKEACADLTKAIELGMTGIEEVQKKICGEN